jgi:hypothetical protein
MTQKETITWDKLKGMGSGRPVSVAETWLLGDLRLMNNSH